jgi:multiple antibiotic resistance protein
MLGPGEVFTLFFITLGPLKLLGPFAASTRALEPGGVRALALRVFALSVVVLGAGGWLGTSLAANWRISLPALMIAGAVIFFLVALSLVLQQYEPAQPPQPLPEKPIAAALQLTFPTVVTPYGLAGLIALLAASQDTGRTGMIYGFALGVMVLNLLAMIFARAIMSGAAVGLVLRLLGAVLGVLQVALAVQIFLRALRELKVIG